MTAYEPPDLYEQYKQARDKKKQDTTQSFLAQMKQQQDDPNAGFASAAVRQASTPAPLAQPQIPNFGVPSIKRSGGGGGGGPSGPINVHATGAKSWGGFAKDLLQSLGAPVTNENLSAILTWFVSEQPPNRPNAAWNPLNIQNSDFANMGLSKSGPGQWNFTSEGQGIQAIARELQTRLYSGILSALMQGNNPQGVLAAIQASPWAESHYGGQLVGRYNPNAYQSLAGGMIAG